MHKNSLRRNTFSPLMQKTKVPPHLLRLRNKQDKCDNERVGRIQLPSLPRQKSWKNDNDILSIENSAATSVSWSQGIEDVAIHKLEEEWAIVERSFYEEDNQLPYGPILDECMQWRIQIPYLRIIGKNPAYIKNDMTQDDSILNSKKMEKLQNDKVLMEHNVTMREEEEDNSTECKLHKAALEDVLDSLVQYVISELYLNKENDTDSLCENFSNSLKIAPAICGNNSLKNVKTNWAEEAISHNYIENKSLSIRNRLLDMDSSLETIKNNVNYSGVQRKKRNSISANKPRDFGMRDDDSIISKERLCTSHVSRNKLGTVFSEKIVVSPVPFAISTRESFSTLKTMPIRFMNENLDFSSFQEPVGNFLTFRNPVKKSTLRNSNIHSAWQAPVCPTVWPKNVRLAPIDTSRLPNSKNRSLALSPAILHCSRKPLNPISRPTIPKSAHAIYNHNHHLEIQGKHIVPVQSSKNNLLSAGWDYSPRVVKNKKKNRSKEEP